MQSELNRTGAFQRRLLQQKKHGKIYICKTITT